MNAICQLLYLLVDLVLSADPLLPDHHSGSPRRQRDQLPWRSLVASLSCLLSLFPRRKLLLLLLHPFLPSFPRTVPSVAPPLPSPHARLFPRPRRSHTHTHRHTHRPSHRTQAQHGPSTGRLRNQIKSPWVIDWVAIFNFP